ncbi:MAG: gliding motility-associated C-terminal domain-containing protein [Chryseolinea sp.]
MSLARSAHPLLLALALCVFALTVYSQQCALPIRTYLPIADEVPYEEFGSAIDSDAGYMVVGAQGNSNLQGYAGYAFVYKLNASNKWVKIADLKPSDPMKQALFGFDVDILGSTIVIYAREFNDEGSARSKLYVYEKDPSDEWVTSTEDYIIVKPFETIWNPSNFGQYEMRGDELIVMAQENNKEYVEIYKRSAGRFTLSQSIEIPNPIPVRKYDWNLKAGDDFIVIGHEQYEHADYASGVVFIFDHNGTTYNTTPAMLTAAGQSPTNFLGFGMSIATFGHRVFVQGTHPNALNTDYNQTYYVIEKPPGGWVNATPNWLYESTGYGPYDQQLVANENYILCTGYGYQNIAGFKKTTATWTSAATSFTIDNIDVTKSDVGIQVVLTDDHLLIGCRVHYRWSGFGEEMIADYYSPSGAWETPGLSFDKILQQKSINATDDLFGIAFDVWNGQLAITARNDDEHSYDGGAVYVYNTLSPSLAPIQKIFSPEEENYTGFGQTIAVGDSIMFIGAPYMDSLNSIDKFYSMGKVYVYRLTSSGWKYSSQIIPPTVHSEQSFGQRVVCTPGYCAITEFNSGSSENVGHVYIYKEDPATGKFKYLASLDPAEHLRFDFFGNSMVMTDSMMVIGTGSAALNSSYIMSAYVFKKKGEWKTTTEDARLAATDSGWSDRFGASVSMSGDYIIVGAPYSPGFDPQPIPRSYIIPGAAYIFKRPSQGWTGAIAETAKLTPSDPIEFGTFGSSVIIDHDDIYVGAPGPYAQYDYSNYLTNTDNRLRPGKIYHYTMPSGGWVSSAHEDRQQVSVDPEIIDGYGGAMRVVDRTLYVSAVYDDTNVGFRSGSVQVEYLSPVVQPYTLLCTDETPTQLFGYPRGGVWSGSAINPTTGKFNTVTAGPGIHTVTYNYLGCISTAQVEVLPDQLAVTSISDPIQTKCIGTKVNLELISNEDAKNYAWYYKESPAGIRTKIDSMKEVITPSKTGYYDVIVHRGICPGKSASFQVIDEPAISIDIDPVSSICTSLYKVQLTATPTSGQWRGTNITSDGIFNPFNLSDGNYKEVYEVITPIGCHWKDSINVTIDILKPPVLQYDGQPICGNTVNLVLNNIDANTAVKWYRADGTQVDGQTNVVYSVGLPGTYYAMVSKNSCQLPSDPATVITVTDSLFVPNVFTANDDHINDHFEVQSSGINAFHMLLFNRDGQTLFETDDQKFQWPGENVPAGVYFWRVTYMTCERVRKEEKGWVHLRR